jgi:hypothetical protein
MSVLLAPRIGAEAAAAALETLASDDPVALAAAIEAARRGRSRPAAGSGADAAAAMDADEMEGGTGNDEREVAANPARPVAAAQTSAAAIAALAAGAARAKLMADEQAAEMERATRRVVRAQLSRVGIKLKFLERVDQVKARATRNQLRAFVLRALHFDSRRRRRREALAAQPLRARHQPAMLGGALLISACLFVAKPGAGGGVRKTNGGSVEHGGGEGCSGRAPQEVNADRAGALFAEQLHIPCRNSNPRFEPYRGGTEWPVPHLHCICYRGPPATSIALHLLQRATCHKRERAQGLCSRYVSRAPRGLVTSTERWHGCEV